MRQEKCELVTAVARANVHLADLGGEQLGDAAQGVVARGVPVGVVHRLEAIDVEQGE
ncbi:MAG TPA: hypothetical protein VLM85_09445 [Polyangiaceae bacterium]|nr:hypothetical protein [Polyangiaceae bacterium]